MDRISNEEVRRRADRPPLAHIIRTTRLKFFGHISHMLIGPWTTVERSGPVLPPDRGTGTADHAELVKLGSAQLNLMSGNCLSSSTTSAGVEVVRMNGNVSSV